MKSILFVTLLSLLSVFMIEISVRLLSSIFIDSNLIFYGTRFRNKKTNKKNPKITKKDHTVKYHENIMNGYTKYYPYEKKRHNNYIDQSFDVRINNTGFRGYDFSIVKPSNGLRIACLGASSTFGYGSKDDQTYPYYLNDILNTNDNNKNRFEVMNFGIPHLTTTEICSLFKYEVIKMKPDVVTIYSGVNNAAKILDVNVENFIGMILDKLSYRMLSFKFIDNIHDYYLTLYTIKDFNKSINSNRNNYIKDIRFIKDLCDKNGIVLILMTQQAKSYIITQDEMRITTYEQELEEIRKKLNDTKYISRDEITFLIHGELMKDLYKISVNDNIILIDLISILNDSRNLLISWVHLKPEGNKKIARAIYKKIYNDVLLKK